MEVETVCLCTHQSSLHQFLNVAGKSLPKILKCVAETKTCVKILVCFYEYGSTFRRHAE